MAKKTKRAAAAKAGETVDSLRAYERTLKNMAAEAHAKLPQYRGHWEGFVLCRITKEVRTKMGLAFNAGELAICRPQRHEVSAADDRKGKGFTARTVYSQRNGLDTEILDAEVEVVPTDECLCCGGRDPQIVSRDPSTGIVYLACPLCETAREINDDHPAKPARSSKAR